jgi:hypothetical protein
MLLRNVEFWTPGVNIGVGVLYCRHFAQTWPRTYSARHLYRIQAHSSAF